MIICKVCTDVQKTQKILLHILKFDIVILQSDGNPANTKRRVKHEYE